MAISVKDIQEKQFPTQASDGYNVEQVDDFLDEIADQLGTLIRENLVLKGQVSKLEDELDAKQKALDDAVAKRRTTTRKATSRTCRARCAIR